MLKKTRGNRVAQVGIRRRSQRQANDQIASGSLSMNSPTLMIDCHRGSIPPSWAASRGKVKSAAAIACSTVIDFIWLTTLGVNRRATPQPTAAVLLPRRLCQLQDWRDDSTGLRYTIRPLVSCEAAWVAAAGCSRRHHVEVCSLIQPPVHQSVTYRAAETKGVISCESLQLIGSSRAQVT